MNLVKSSQILSISLFLKEFFHHHSYTGFQSNKVSITNSVFSHTKHSQINNLHYLYNSLSFPSHTVSTRSSDSLVLSIPYVRSSLGKRAFSVIGPRLWNSLPPETRKSKLVFFAHIPFQAQNTPLQNCIPSWAFSHLP